MRVCLSILTFFLFFSSFAQEEVAEFKVIDSLYREDQFYINFTYNSLRTTPDGLKQTKFSPGFSLGFLRDIPINKNRTYAFAVGLGYTMSVYKHNLYTYQTDNPDGSSKNNYEIISSDIYYAKNKQSQHFIELPIEFRWRTSTPNSHMFWRIYTGFKMSYLVGDTYKFVNDIQTITINKNADFNKIQYGCYLAAGWNTWNFYAYYGLSPLYKSAEINGEKIRMNTFNIGLQFYIL